MLGLLQKFYLLPLPSLFWSIFMSLELLQAVSLQVHSYFWCISSFATHISLISFSLFLFLFLAFKHYYALLLVLKYLYMYGFFSNLVVVNEVSCARAIDSYH
jgi:hypothetical protein